MGVLYDNRFDKITLTENSISDDEKIRGETAIVVAPGVESFTKMHAVYE